MNKIQQREDFMLGKEQEDRRYFLHNKKRFELILGDLERIIKANKNVSVLDIGTSPLTFLIRKKYKNINLTTLDYSNNFKKDTAKQKIKFIQEDLNKRETKLKKNQYDAILFLEVIEHLKGNNKDLLNKLVESLKTNGHLFIQTPNRNSLKSVVLRLLGENTWNDMSSAPEVTEEFHHFKEYEFDELKNILDNLKGAKLVRSERPMYFDIPESTMVYRKNKVIFYPLMYLSYLITYIFPIFRRGMHYEVVKK